MSQFHFSWEQRLGSLAVRSRRTFLQATTCGIGAIEMLGTCAAGLTPGPSEKQSRGTACIVFFCDGGPSHHDTFDPKPNAPTEVRGEFGVIDTAVPGLRVSEHLPLLARQAEHFALLRSLHHGNPSHAPAEHQMLTGRMGSRPGTARAVIEAPSLGSIVSRMRGPRRRGLPAYVAVPWNFHHAYGGSPFGAASYLGPRYEPFESGHLPKNATDDFEVPELKLPGDMPATRLQKRRSLLGRIDRLGDDELSRDPLKRSRVLTDEAMDMLVNKRVREAFDLTREPPSLREQYGPHEWGQSALLGRRLVESGVTFIMLQCGLRQDWDTHDANFVKLKKNLLPPLDRAVATLIGDLVDRGLFDKTLVLVMGEFGRTPIVNKDAGRDHWADVFSVLISGGGLRGGQVVGSSDKTGAYPHHRTLHVQDLLATMYKVVGIDGHTLFHDRQGRGVPILGHGTPIPELLSSSADA